DSLYCHLHLHPTDLHSFPTRRSSDLPGKVLLGGRHAQPVGPDQLARYRRGQRTVSTGPPFSMAVPAARGNGRSSKRVRDNCPRCPRTLVPFVAVPGCGTVTRAGLVWYDRREASGARFPTAGKGNSDG